MKRLGVSVDDDETEAMERPDLEPNVMHRTRVALDGGGRSGTRFAFFITSTCLWTTVSGSERDSRCVQTRM